MCVCVCVLMPAVSKDRFYVLGNVCVLSVDAEHYECL